MHTSATTKQLKKKAFTINRQNIIDYSSEEIAVKKTFILEIKLQKYIFLSKYDHFLASCLFLGTPVRIRMCIRMHD